MSRGIFYYIAFLSGDHGAVIVSVSKGECMAFARDSANTDVYPIASSMSLLREFESAKGLWDGLRTYELNELEVYGSVLRESG